MTFTLKLIRRVQRYQNRPWYRPLLAGLAAFDLFVAVIPTDALVISASMLRPKQWFRTAIWLSAGSAFGAFLLAATIRLAGDPILTWLFGSPTGPESWHQTSDFLDQYGAWALAAMAAGPLPQQPAVAVCALAKMPLELIALSVFAGRAGKYLVFAYSATHARKFLRKKKSQKPSA